MRINRVYLTSFYFSSLALAYGGSQRQDLIESISPSLDTADMATASVSALALGHVFVASANGDVASRLIHFLMNLDESQKSSAHSKTVSLGLATVFLGQQEASITIIEALNAIEHPIGKYTSTLVEICSFCGTGNVLQIQKLLHDCSKSLLLEKNADTSHLSVAVIGIALISMADEISREMAMRSFSHMMFYGDKNIKKAVPLAIGLLYASNPIPSVVEILSKHSHDHDKSVALNSIFSMGLVGAGTNNAKIAQNLQQLSLANQKDLDFLFVIRVAQVHVHLMIIILTQGLLAMGKGMLSISPIRASIVSFTSVSGILAVILPIADNHSMIMERFSYLLYFLAPSIFPKILLTVDENLNHVPVSVKVGNVHPHSSNFPPRQ